MGKQLVTFVLLLLAPGGDGLTPPAVVSKQRPAKPWRVGRFSGRAMGGGTSGSGSGTNGRPPAALASAPDVIVEGCDISQMTNTAEGSGARSREGTGRESGAGVSGCGGGCGGGG